MNGRNISTRVVAFLLALVMCVGLVPFGALSARAETADPDLTAALAEARTYIDAITVNNAANDPATVVGNFGTHFTWDNEKRENSKSYLFDWSYYNGVVFEGLEYLYEVTGEEVYKDYVVEYMSTMINATGNWATCANNPSKVAAGYNATHGADCYKTASLLLDAYAMSGDDRYLYTAAELYGDLDTASLTYLIQDAGNNFHHTWASASNPALWLDGLYMILPFRAEYAKHIGDTEELDLIVSRMQWVSDNMYDEEKGLFYHAANSATSNSGTFWLRSIGWYAAAIVDIMDSMSGENLQTMKAQLVKLVDGMRACQNPANGMWLNNMAAPQSTSNPYETSGTALVCYAVLKAVNNGWLDESYADMAILAFKGICNEKLSNNNLTDICFKGAPGSSNSTFYDNEGKGLGPFIMFYAEALEYAGVENQEPEVPETTEPETTEPETTEPETTEPETTEPAAEDQTVTTGGVTANVSGVAAQLTGEALSDGDKALLDAKGYAAYVALDVTGTVAAGETAVVTFAIPDGWDLARVVGVHIENGAVVEIPGTVSGGSFTFEVSHFSGVGIALLAETPVSKDGNLVGNDGYTYTLDTDGVEAGGKYLIVAEATGWQQVGGSWQQVTTYHALTNNNNTAGDTVVTRNDDTITIPTDTNSKVAWTFSDSESGTVGNNGRYVYPQYSNYSGSLSLNTNGTDLTISDQGSGQYRIYRTYVEEGRWGETTYYNYLTYSTGYNSSGWTGSRTSNQNSIGTVYLYKQTAVPSAGEAVNFSITPSSVTLAPTNTQDLTGTVTVAGETVNLSDCTITWASGNNSIATIDNGTVKGVADGNTNITATLSAVDGKALQNNIVLTIPVTVKSHVVTFSTETENTAETEASLSLVVGTNQTLTPYITLDGQSVSLGDCEIEWSTGDSSVATCTGGLVNAIAASDVAVAITATLTKVNDLPTHMTVTYHVTVVNKAIQNAYLSNMEGYVIKNSGMNTIIEDANGGKIYVIIAYQDGTSGTAELTLGMIDVDGLNMGIAGVHPDRKVTYQGFEIPGFQLNVLGNPGNNFPQYPEPGSVRVNKVIGDGSQFQDTGVAEIQLSTSGLPMKAGLDVVLTIDISNSMCWATGSSDKEFVTNNKLLEVMESVKDFAEILLAPNEDGSATDNTITIVIFGGKDADNWDSSGGTTEVDSVRTLVTATSSLDVINKIADNTKFTASDTIQIAHIPSGKDANNVNNVVIDAAGANRGDTNYDYAFWQTKKAIVDGGLGGDKREVHVVLMSDGCPSHYNDMYYRTKNNYYYKPGTTESYNTRTSTSGLEWTDWVLDSIVENHGNKYAIELYNLVNGNVYAVGFDMANGSFSGAGTWDTSVDWAARFNEILGKSVTDRDGNAGLAVGSALVDVTGADDTTALNNFYTSLANAFRQAAKEAYFVDQLSDSFNLQMASSVTKFNGQVDANGKPLQQVITLKPAPQIQISTYNIYRKIDVGTHTFTPTAEMVGYMYYGVLVTNAMVGKSQTGTVTEAMVGERYGAPTIIETVTFNADGTEAYSNLINNGETDILGADGVIDAVNFWYNTKFAPVTLTLEDGSTFQLDSEAFRWNIGTINDKEFVLSYYVYLDGAVEGNVPAGSYKTNNYADLYYVNWLDNHVTKETVSPQLAWQSAQVSVAFYLVDANGNPMTNISTGATGSFYDAIKLTTPVVFDTVNLNSSDTIIITEDDLDHLLVGYDLYDTDSVYTIAIDSDNESSQWSIAKGAGKVQSLYVTNFYGAYASNLASSSDLPWSSGVDYSNTVAWFAVVYKASTVPDVVVIDYGLPVDIDVLYNDMLNETAALVGVGAYNNTMTFTNSHGEKTLGMTYTGTYGAAQVYGSQVRYTPGTMSMNSYEEFAYEVHQEVNGADQYYYGSVKVIPATTVYYEDSFITYSEAEWIGNGWQPLQGGNDAAFQWTHVPNSNRTQAEDRPGQHSLPEIDADNVYGFDGAYTDVAEYSMNGYAKVKVDYDHTAYAEFDFYGTGFDVISLTNCTTGTIFVSVYPYQASGNYNGVATVKAHVVDTYYGYKREFWQVTYEYDADTKTWEPKSEAKTDTLGTSAPIPENPTDGSTYTAYETRWVPDPSNADTIYQVPVMKIGDLTYGRYHAVIQVAYDPFLENVEGSTDYDFYLDAIRIYDPAGNQYKDNVNETIQDAYVADGEGWPVYFELRNYMLSAGSFSEDAVELLGENHRLTGAVFIDGNEAVGDAQMTDYKNFGPNNELYLAPGQDVAFILNLDDYKTYIADKDANGNPTNVQENGSIVASVQLGIKSATGEEVNYTICNINTVGEYYAAEGFTLKTSTDMYYNITDYRGDLIVISNTNNPGNGSDVGKILSITNIKVTFTEDPTKFQPIRFRENSNAQTPAQANDMSAAANIQTLSNGVENQEEEVGLIYMTYEAVQRTLHTLNTRSLPGESEEPEEVIPETTEPETTEPETTEPETTEPETTEPETTEPETTEPEATKPGDNKPGDNKPGDNKPGDNKPGDNKPGDNKPGDNKPGDNKPGNDKPGNDKPGDNKPGNDKPGDNKPGNDKPGDNKPGNNKPEETKPEPTAPAPVEPEEFEPWFLEMFVSDSSVKVGEKVVITVITSADVESLTVNGREVKHYVESGWWIKTRTWIVTLKASEAGEMVIDVVVYDDDSVASGTTRQTVDVQERKPGPGGKPSGKKHN